MAKQHAGAGLLAICLSTVTILTMAHLRTDGYDHLHKAISELGSLDAPNGWLFNLAGYLLPGLLISYFSLGLHRSWQQKHTFFVSMLFLSGLFFSLAGLFPMDMSHRRSVTSLIHTAGSLGSGVTWFLAGLGSWWVLRNEAGWRDLALALELLPLIGLVLVLVVPADTPGLGQRFMFISYFLFIGLLSARLWLLDQPPPNTDTQP